MAIIVGDQNFIGANTQIEPTRLPDGFGVDLRNARPGTANLQPYNASTTVYSIGAGAQRISLYRMGRATPSDTLYWLSSVNDVDYVRSLLADDPTERIYYTGESEPRVTDNILALGSAPYPAAYRTLGVPYSSSGFLAALLTSGTGPNETRSYLDTFVSDRGEESAPNSTPRSIVVPGGSTVTLSSLAAPPSGSAGITLRRIYASAGNDYQLTVEQGAGLTSAVDNNVRGRVLASGGSLSRPAWLPPPAGLRGLIELQNGMLVGFVGKSFQVCEPFKPWAWPLEYVQVVSDEIVGLGVWNKQLVVLTTDRPMIFAGSSPYLTEVPAPFQQACVSKRSIVSLDNGVCWAGAKGLCYIGRGGERIVTADIFTEIQWRAMNPATMRGQRLDADTYICFFTVGAVESAFRINPENPQGVVFIDQGAFGSFYDTISDKLYLLDAGNVVKKWDSGAPMTVSYKTGVTRWRQECCPGAMKIESKVYPVAFQLFADGVLIHSRSVTSKEPFRLPSGYMAQQFQRSYSVAGAMTFGLLAEEIGDLAQ